MDQLGEKNLPKPIVPNGALFVPRSPSWMLKPTDPVTYQRSSNVAESVVITGAGAAVVSCTGAAVVSCVMAGAGAAVVSCGAVASCANAICATPSPLSNAAQRSF